MILSNPSETINVMSSLDISNIAFIIKYVIGFFLVGAWMDSLELLIDCSLTDLGREKLSKGDGSFKITQFAPCDTEIDYTLYNTSAATNIAAADILNTPIMEALTNESANEQYELITISDSKIRYLPTLTAGSNTLAIDEFTNSAQEKIITITPTLSNKGTIPAEIVDTLYYVYVNDKFLEVSNYSAFLGLDSAFDYAGYAVDSDFTVNSFGGRNLTVKVKSKPIDDTTWTIFADTGTVSPTRTITSNIKIKGAVSGLTKNITCTISEKQ